MDSTVSACACLSLTIAEHGALVAEIVHREMNDAGLEHFRSTRLVTNMAAGGGTHGARLRDNDTEVR